MKTKEFIKRVEGLAFEVENGKEYYYIKDIDGELIASINKLITFQICTNFNAWDELCDDLIKKQLFDIISKYTSTPIEDREEKTYRYEVFCEIDIKAKSKEEAIRKLEKDYGNYFSTYVGVVNEDGDVKEVEE